MNPLGAEEAAIRAALACLKRPTNFFAGVTLHASLAPDNILFFRQTDTHFFRPEGVTDNYHHRFELVIVLERSGPVRIGETSYELAPGEAALIFPNQFHHYMDVEPGPMQWLFITFELAERRLLRPLRDRPRRLPQSAPPLIARLLQEYTRPAPPGGEGPDGVVLSALLAQFLREMLRAPLIARERRNIHATDQARDLLLEKINHYVRAHLSETVTIGTLARGLGYSESHVRSVFRNRLGVSLGRYIRESRLSVAARLLQEEKEGTTIADIAARAGFSSLFSFSRAFKNAYGCSPRGYAKRLHQNPPLP
ncbi:MAG TPA: AraC family transcriptional regulator [Chthoniobacteraceae bacterium]|nr:AraC family transcriptional regulator [Chthoniobacteraceae bacterium]